MRLLDFCRLGPSGFQVVPQFHQRIELAVGVGEEAWVFGGGHVAGQGYAVRDAVLQGDHDGSPAGRGLVSGESEGAFEVELFVFRNGVAVEGDGFDFGEHKVRSRKDT